MLCLPLAIRKSLNSTETKILPLTRKSKKLYYFSYLMNLINNMKKTWARINEVMNRNKLKSIISFNYLPAIIYQEDSSDSLKKIVSVIHPTSISVAENRGCQWCSFFLLGWQVICYQVDIRVMVNRFLHMRLWFSTRLPQERVKTRRNLTNETEQSVYIYIV